MRKVYSSITLVIAIASITTATFLAAQKAATQRKPSVQRKAAGNAGARQRSSRTNRSPRATPTGPTRTADPNRAPQAAVDDALFTNEEFFGAQASVARPYSIALERVGALLSKYPKDSRLHLQAARLAERLGQYDKATTEMSEYADLKKRSPDALRRLANFYHDRARFADEVRTLRELAKSLLISERGPVYKRAAQVVRSHSLKEFKPADFFAELVAADPSNIQPIKDYVQELQLAKQNKEAVAVLVSFQSKFPSDLGYFLKIRAAILESSGDRRAAEDVYSSAFDPNWPRAVASDYYDLVRRFGRYRIIRRGLQERVRLGAVDLDTVGRLFSIFSYEGSYEPASRLLRDLEDRRTKKVAQAASLRDQATNTAQAGSLRDQPTNTAQAGSLRYWTPRELETVASMFTSIGDYDQASRYLYTLYLTGGLQQASEQREQALYRLFKVMLDAAGSPTRVAAGDLSFYKDVAELDQHPGFMNGVLSLILSGADPAGEFEKEEKGAASYFNRAFAYRIFTSFKQEYAQSNHLPEMYLGVVNVFSALGEHKLAIETGREFQQRFSDSPRYGEVSLRIADSYVALQDRGNERAVLGDLLDRLARSRKEGTPLLPLAAKRWSWGSTPVGQKLIDRIRYNIEAYSDTYDPTADKDSVVKEEQVDDDDESDGGEEEVATPADESESDRGPAYSSVLERYVSSLAVEDKKTETVAFFWGEIKKHPREEGLYERFLSWLGQAQLVNEQLKAYNSAINQFDSNTWYHRLARWYVRQKRGKELTRYSRQLIGVFDEEEISDYLLRFAGYGATPAGDELNWDEKLAFDLYSFAHARFPRNLFFVRGMLTHLAKGNRAQWEKLSAEYYFADRSIREPYLEWLSKQGKLREAYAQATARRADGTLSRPISLSSYRVFAADAALWLSHHDEALDAYRLLAASYPGEPQYAERLGDLTRSFGQQSDKLYEESARVFSQMADIYPSEHEYRIKAGEVYAQLGDFKRAGAEWDKLTQLEPGERNTYLEVATVYWDYYQFDQAVRVFKDLRNVTGDQSIYAYRLGAVYEGKGDIDSAVAEYVKVLDEPGDGRDTVVKRLAQLSRRAGLPEKIAGAYEKERAAQSSDWQLVIGFASYQAEREHQADALAMLRTEVSRSNDVAFLESVRDLFREILRPEDEQQVITRLASVARDEREAMMYRLQLASFLERHGQVDQAIAAIDKLTADYPTNLGVVEESAQFYWRAGLFDRSLDLYKRTLARAAGSNRRSLTLQLARRQSDAGKLVEAEATLRAFYNENRADTEVFSQLARTLGSENKLNELAELYQNAFKDVRDSGIGVEAARSRVAELRGGMIRTLDALGKHQDALDQHIEIINSFPEDAYRLASAIDYAEQHNLTDRLVAYYEKLTKEAFKNYRWNVVLGRIYERRGNLAGAAEQYRTAVVNEPQRADLRFALASSLARQRRYDEAIATLREGWRLAGRAPEWLIEVANIQVQQGKRDDAVQTIRQALAEKKNVKARDRFDLASKLELWGLNAEASRMYDQVFAGLATTLKDEAVYANDVTGYVRALVVTEPVVSIYQKMERLRTQFDAIGQNSKDTDGYKAKMIVTAIDAAMRSDFGSGVTDYATAGESTALVSEMRASIAKLTSYRDAPELRRYLGIARGAALVDVEEQIQIRLKDAAFDVRPKTSPAPTSEDTQFYSELRALVNFYDRHAAYGRAAEALTAESGRDPYKNRFEYQNEIASQYRLAGDRQRELEALRAAYARASGSLTTDTRDWIERYFALLHSAGNRSELQRLASTYNPYQLQLINFLIEKNEKELALDAIASAKQSAAWVASRSGEAGLFLKDTSPDNELFFRKALDVRPIGQMLGRRIESGGALVGTDWYLASRNFGYWLGLVGREPDSRKFVVGELEGHPDNARAQLELAAYYLDRKNATRAGDHVKLAAELEPDSRSSGGSRSSCVRKPGSQRSARGVGLDHRNACVNCGRTNLSEGDG
ncbi:MAG TPA: tetratricopeptide repeat protein [Blastocatellia bacterium]|nr:tetratricopeptide repeat protein [Blastocatellia bacterium]